MGTLINYTQIALLLHSLRINEYILKLFLFSIVIGETLLNMFEYHWQCETIIILII